jgi:hypothetical protein
LPSDKNINQVLGIFPERIRALVSGILWSYADEYMHSGPSQRFVDVPYQAGSYAGNTEVTSLMQQIIVLTPDQLAPYKILAMNLARYLNRFTDAMRVIQSGIRANRGQTWVHQLYAAAAFQYLFDFKQDSLNKEIPLKYLNNAIELAKKADFVADETDPLFSMENYIVLKLRLLVDLKRTKEAVEIWNLNPELHDKKMGILGNMLDKMAAGEDVEFEKKDSLQIQNSSIVYSPEQDNDAESFSAVPDKMKQPTWSRPVVNFLKAFAMLLLTITVSLFAKRSSIN